MNDTTEDAGRQKGYLSYLLRLWQESEERAIWRASLTSPQTGERAGFANLQELFHFLQRQTGAAPDTRGEQDVGQQKGGDHDKSIVGKS